MLDTKERSELQGEFIADHVSKRICKNKLPITGKECNTKMIHQFRKGTYACPNCFNYDNSEYHRHYEQIK